MPLCPHFSRKDCEQSPFIRGLKPAVGCADVYKLVSVIDHLETMINYWMQLLSSKPQLSQAWCDCKTCNMLCLPLLSGWYDAMHIALIKAMRSHLLPYCLLGLWTPDCGNCENVHNVLQQQMSTMTDNMKQKTQNQSGHNWKLSVTWQQK